MTAIMMQSASVDSISTRVTSFEEAETGRRRRQAKVEFRDDFHLLTQKLIFIFLMITIFYTSQFFTPNYITAIFNQFNVIKNPLNPISTHKSWNWRSGHSKLRGDSSSIWCYSSWWYRNCSPGRSSRSHQWRQRSVVECWLICFIR